MKKIALFLFLAVSLSVNATVITPTITITNYTGYLLITESNKNTVTITKPYTVIAESGDVVIRDLFTTQKVVYLSRLTGWTFTDSYDLQAQLMAYSPAPASFTITGAGINVVTGTSPHYTITATEAQTLSISGSTITISGTSSQVILPTFLYAINNITASYTLTATDFSITNMSTVVMTSTVSTTIAIPSNANTPLPVGVHILLQRHGSGAITVVSQSGVTLHAAGGNGFLFQYAITELIQTAIDEWTYYGQTD